MPRRCSGLLHGPSQLQLARVMRLRSKLECCVNSLEIASGAAYRFDRRWHAIFAIGWTSRKKYHLKSCLKQRDRATRFFLDAKPTASQAKKSTTGAFQGPTAGGMRNQGPTSSAALRAGALLRLPTPLPLADARAAQKRQAHTHNQQWRENARVGAVPLSVPFALNTMLHRAQPGAHAAQYNRRSASP